MSGSFGLRKTAPGSLSMLGRLVWAMRARARFRGECGFFFDLGKALFCREDVSGVAENGVADVDGSVRGFFFLHERRWLMTNVAAW